MRGKNGCVKAGSVLVAARPAYGYRYVPGERTGSLEPHPDEAPIVQDMFRWCVEERLSSYAIAKRLCELEIPSRADTAAGIVRKKGAHHTWNPHTIRNILRNETYKGLWHWNKTRMVKHGDTKRQVPRPREEWLTVEVPALVDATVWERAQVQLSNNKANGTRVTVREYLLRGLIFCPSCKRRWYARYKADIDRVYYRCPTAKAEVWAPDDCSLRFSLEQRRLESAVLAAVKDFLLNPDVRAAGIAAEQERVRSERQRPADDLATIDRELAAVDAKLEALLDQAIAGASPTEMIEKRKRDFLAERERRLCDKEHALSRLATADVPDLEAAIEALAPTVEHAFVQASAAELRQLLDILRVEIHVVDRNTVRLTGVMGGPDGSTLVLLSAQKHHNRLLHAPSALEIPLAHPTK
jgi:site-specific DNA recombinase